MVIGQYLDNYIVGPYDKIWGLTKVRRKKVCKKYLGIKITIKIIVISFLQ